MAQETIVLIAASVIFLVVLLVILIDKWHRMVVACLGAAVMVAVGVQLEFYDEHAAIESIDMETIGLLLGMMVLVSLLQPTGFFEYVAIWAGRWSKGQPIRLLILLGTLTTVLSMMLDNVTTIVLIAPVTVLICQIIGMNSRPMLISEAILSNVGGIGTLVGDPPNIIIGSAANLSFADFLANSLPIVFVTWLATLALLIFLFRREMIVDHDKASSVNKMSPREALHKPSDARRILTVLGVAVTAFTFSHGLHVSPAMIALTAASVGFVVVSSDIHEVLQRVEWNVLIFFAALFVIVGGLESAGSLAVMTDVFRSISTLVSTSIFGVALMWIIALMSAFVENVPLTIAFVQVISGLGDSGYNIAPLWWALALGAGLGGNGTIVGAATNIVVASVSERTSNPISARDWMRVGMPVMFVTCFVAGMMYMVSLRFFPWFGS